MSNDIFHVICIDNCNMRVKKFAKCIKFTYIYRKLGMVNNTRQAREHFLQFSDQIRLPTLHWSKI